MRFQVAVPFGAVCTIERVYEIEADDAAQAAQLIDSDEYLELDDDKCFIVGDETVQEIHSCEMAPNARERMVVTRVG